MSATMASIYADHALPELLESLDLDSSATARREDVEIMSYKDIMKALNEPRQERTDRNCHGDDNQDVASLQQSLTSTVSGTSSGPNSSRSLSFSSLFSITSPSSYDYRAVSPPTSVSSESDWEEESYRATRHYDAAIRIPPPPLVELGIHARPYEYLPELDQGYLDALETDSLRSFTLLCDEGSVTPSQYFPYSVRDFGSSFLDLSDDESSESDASDVQIGICSSRGDCKTDVQACHSLAYSETQINLFGAFLRSPFAPSSFSFSSRHGQEIGPYATVAQISSRPC